MYRMDEDKPVPVREPVVDEGILCARCGYDLKGLAVKGRCPECGGPIRNSIQAQSLEYAAPEYLRRLHLGAMLSQIGAGCAMGFAAVIVVMTFVAAVAAGMNQDSVTLWIVLGVISVVGPLASGGLGVAGWWMLTTRDPGAGGSRKDLRVRRVLRVSMVTAAACWGLVCVPPLAKALWNLPPEVYIPLTVVLGVMLVASMLTSVLATGPYLKYLGKRLDDDRLPEVATMQMRLAICAAVAAGLLTLVLACQVYVFVFHLGLATVVLTLVLLGYHAAVMGWTRRLLGAAYRGEPLPRRPGKYKRNANDPFYHRP